MTKPYLLRKDLTLIERETGIEIGHLEHVAGGGADRGWRYVVSWGLHPAVDGGFHRRYEAAAAAWGAFNTYMATTSEPRTTAEWWERVKGRREPLKWVDMFGIDPDYCGGKPVDEWLEDSRGEA